eukprot:g29699.t1
MWALSHYTTFLGQSCRPRETASSRRMWEAVLDVINKQEPSTCLSLVLGYGAQDEAGAVMSFLVATLPKIFSQQHVNSTKLLELLRELRPEFVPKRTELYRSGFETTKVTLVLQGAFHLTSGADQCESTVGPWACLGVGVLLAKADKYTSDFTAVALTDAFILQLERQRYLQAAASDRLGHIDSLA